MLDKLFSKKRKQQDILSIPQRKNPVDLKGITKLGPKALQEIVIDSEKYIGCLVARIEEIRTEYVRVQEKTEELRQKNEVINAQVAKMANEHEELTIKFDNLQNSLEIMISTGQEQLASQLGFIRSSSGGLSASQTLPKTIEQVFTLYRDRFELCGKIGQQNRFLKEKITEIELKFEEIKERYEEAEKQKGLSSLIPELMVSLEELKRERKNSREEMRAVLQLQPESVDGVKERVKEKVVSKEAETMTSEEVIEAPEVKDGLNQLNNVLAQCLMCRELNAQVEQLTQQAESLKGVKESLLEEVGEWSRKYHQLCQSQAKLKQEVKVLVEEKKDNQKAVKGLSEELQAANRSSKKLMEELQKAKRQVETVQSSLEKMREQNQRLKLQIETSSYKLSMKQAEVNGLSLKLVQEKEKAKGSQQQGSEEKPGQGQSLATVYEQQIKRLTDQSQANMQQIIALRQQNISKALQIAKLTESFQKAQTQLQNLKQSLTHSQQIANQIQVRYKKLMAQNQEQLMDKIRSLETRNGENEKELIYLRNAKLTQEQDNKKLSAVKKTLQQQVRQLDSYKSDIESRILPNLRTELQTAKKQCSRISQQKQMIQQNSLENINQLNNNYQFLLVQKEAWGKQKSEMENKIIELQKENATKRSEIESFEQMTDKLNKEMTDKLLQVQKLSQDIKTKSQQTQQLYEQLRSKQRKYQSQLNQQRIKLQALKRTNSVQQTKLQQNQKSSNKFYQQSMHKDKKISYMEVKLKEYKHLIQSLRKEKEEVERSYLEKIRGYEESIVEVVSEEEVGSERGRKNGEEMKSESGKNVEVARSEGFSEDKDTEYFRNQILSFQQANLVLKQENASLREQIKQLQEETLDRKKQVESLQEKRQQTLKEIEKLNLRSINGSLQQTNGNFLQKQQQFLKEKQEFQAYKQKAEQRMKKIALKAYKGFDILLKRHHSLYKQFMAVFVKEIADREEVKNIESEINMLVNKSTDMKDVFQDYL